MSSTLLRNTAGQHFTFCMINATTGQGDPSLTVIGFVTQDGGVQVAAAGIVTSLGDGQFTYSPTQAETNAVDVGFYFTAAGGVPVNVDFHTDATPSWPCPDSPGGPPPTLTGFVAFIRSSMGITTTVLPDGSFWITAAYNVAIGIVNRALSAVCIDPCTGMTIYALAVYNLAASNLLNFAQDLPGAAIVPGSDPAAPFFAYTRAKWNMTSFVSGVVSSTSDEGTSMSLVVPEQLAQLTIANLQQLKDPYGRVYLGFAQDYGTLWGLS